MMENRVHTSSGLTVYAQRRERLAEGPKRQKVGLTVPGRPGLPGRADRPRSAAGVGSGFASRRVGSDYLKVA